MWAWFFFFTNERYKRHLPKTGELRAAFVLVSIEPPQGLAGLFDGNFVTRRNKQSLRIPGSIEHRAVHRRLEAIDQMHYRFRTRASERFSRNTNEHEQTPCC